MKPGEYTKSPLGSSARTRKCWRRGFKIPKYPAGTYIGLTRVPEDRPTAAAPAGLTLANETLECRGLARDRAGDAYPLPSPEHRPGREVRRPVPLSRQGRSPLSEEQDEVVGCRRGERGKPDGFELMCTNPGLPDIELTKAYRLEADRLVKVVYFRAASDRNDGELIFLRSTLRMPPDFYRDGYAYRPLWDGGGWVGRGAVPFVPGNSIADRRPLKDLDCQPLHLRATETRHWPGCTINTR